MNSLRRATPDSEAVASSEDERPWPTARSFGTFPRKENSVPGLGGTIWTTQKRDSFKMEKAAQRNALREARLMAPNGSRSGLRADATPSPAASDASGTLPFSIPSQPAPKAGRSMSHSQGQREVSSGANDHTVLPLGLLAEEADTESESELGGGLTHTTSHPPIGTLQRPSTFHSTYDSFYGGNNGRDTLQASGSGQGGSRADRQFETAFGNLSLDPPLRRSQWQSKLGWDDVPNVNESRRHSLADIPTRRGSLVAAENRPRLNGSSYWGHGDIFDWEGAVHEDEGHNYRDAQQLLDFGQATSGHNNAHDRTRRVDYIDNMKYFDKDEQGRPLNIPNEYRVPFITIDDHERERGAQDQSAGYPTASITNLPWMNGRPRKLLFIVSFKCSRVDLFYLLENTGLEVKEGDIVIVEADRGQDLGTVQHANVTQEEARIYKKKYNEEQYKWLMMFSKNNTQSSVNPNAQIYGENRGEANTKPRSNLLANAPPTMQGAPRDGFNNLKAKAIKRLANGHEIRMLSEKEGNEAKAKRACQQKVAHLRLDMEILDAEWQWDFQKLIFYYYADHYINFKDLITELYRIYKTRIWLSAINPASFSQHALGQPPSGIGPGAVVDPSGSNTYTATYGGDPDPYGAVPPYRIGYETYTPNYPAIPGVSNSFPQQQLTHLPVGGAYPATTNHDPTPSLPPGAPSTFNPADYNYYYDRSAMPNVDLFQLSGPYPQPSYSAASFNNTPAMANDRTKLNYLFSPGSIAAATNAAFASVRPGFPAQPPIGTRPGSSGTTGTTSFAYMGNNPTTIALSRRLNASTAPDFVPGQAIADGGVALPAYGAAGPSGMGAEPTREQ